MDRSRRRAAELRKVVAQAVASDPTTFNEGFLGKQVDEYCRWIQEKDKWGGAIELFIFSEHYGVELAAFDIRTRRCDVYGQDKGYDTRALLIYDGLHYDALAVAAFEGAPEELDVTMFSPGGRDGAAIMEAAEKLVAATNAARQFTDTANFTLRCAVCQMGLKGEKEAVEHAKTTGHSNFAEY
ncbi:Ubiquitin thioesterase OTU1 [Tetrabaena socialis]|uniref:Ubiquitin thioesterase OTU n=1 Tax=Tetrabaena socialis TaxID=47790 RepID=A0A2J7ZSP3_9CHLO|nr:Ubiquitin thioesterase OTU1 [Tetrabaena socialis]|eukprot:PNH03286.1 Ubiquitin thioesterase OTU1 [Tetrabaena socialis]